MALPDNGSYIVAANNVLIADGRQLAAGTGIGLVDGGPQSFITISVANFISSLQSIGSGGPAGFLCQTATNTAASRTLTTDGTLSITNPAGTAGNPILAVTPNSTVQKVQVYLTGTLQNTASGLNLIPGTNVSITAVPSAFGTNVTIASTDTGFNNPMTTLGDIITGGASGVAQRLGVGAEGQALKVSGGVPAWSSDTGFNNPMTTAGDLILAGVAGAPGRLGIGTTGQALIVSGGTATWASQLFDDGSSNLFVGKNAGNQAGLAGSSNNTVVGQFAGNALSAVNGNTLIGCTAGPSVTGAFNTAVGLEALHLATTTTDTVAIGFNTAAAQLSYTGGVFLGAGSDAGANSLSNMSAIGCGALVNQSNTTNIGGVTGGVGQQVCIQMADPHSGAVTRTAGLILGNDNSVNPHLYFTSSTAPATTAVKAGDIVLSVNANVLQATTSTGTTNVVLNPMTTSQDLIVGGASGKPTRLGVGGNGTVLTVSGGNITWGSIVSLTQPSTGSLVGGTGAGAGLTTGLRETLLGQNCFTALAGGNDNTGFGYNVFPSVTTGARNVGVGSGTGASLGTGATDNVLLGYGVNCETAGLSLTQSIAIGSGALFNASTCGVIGYNCRNSVTQTFKIGNGASTGVSYRVGINMNDADVLTDGITLGNGTLGVNTPPSIYFTAASITTTQPSVANDALIYAAGGQMLVNSGTAAFSGTIVTAVTNATSAGNATAGTATLVTGTVTVATTAVTAKSVIILTLNTPGGTLGVLAAPSAARSNGVHFIIQSYNLNNTSNNADTSTVDWQIINPA